MMLQLRDDNFIAGVYKGFAKRESHQIDRLGGATRENDLVGIGSIDIARHFAACFFERIRGTHSQSVVTAMHIAV